MQLINLMCNESHMPQKKHGVWDGKASFLYKHLCIRIIEFKQRNNLFRIVRGQFVYCTQLFGNAEKCHTSLTTNMTDLMHNIPVEKVKS